MHSVAWWPTLIVLTVVTWTDLRSRRIPNIVVLPYLVIGLAVSIRLHGLHGLTESLIGMVVGSAFFGFLAWMGGMGMGDVKLCAAIGVWIGASQMLLALVLTGIAGAVIAICWAIKGGFVGEMFSNTGDLLFSRKEKGLQPHPEFVLENPRSRKMPYAPAIAIGTLISFFS
jgi:prepilin peptidase CpaA